MLWLKASHIIFMVTWFAGLFYLPRLFVYHAMADAGDATGIARFKVMERKLFWGIMTPGGAVTAITGLWLVALNWQTYFADNWLSIKLALIVPLVAYHIWCGALVKRFAADANTHSHKWYRLFNEVPTVLLIAIIVLAVVRPL